MSRRRLITEIFYQLRNFIHNSQVIPGAATFLVTQILRLVNFHRTIDLGLLSSRDFKLIMIANFCHAIAPGDKQTNGFYGPVVHKVGCNHLPLYGKTNPEPLGEIIEK